MNGTSMRSDIKGVVFDKDGTLFDYQQTWIVWCERVLSDLAAGDAALKQRLAAACGFDLQGRRFIVGSLIVNASAQDVNAVWVENLPGASYEAVNRVALRHVKNLPCFPVCDLSAALNALRRRKIVLGVATNDYEVGAVNQLRDAGVEDMFDFVCGFDSGYGIKPGPGMIGGFCAQTGLAPVEVAMVGDSTHDLLAGRAAGVGLNVGVLTGPAEAEDLLGLADMVLPDISHLPGVLFGVP